MKSTASQNSSDDGHFPYGNQPSYRDFIMPKELEAEFEEFSDVGLSGNPCVVARYFYPL